MPDSELKERIGKAIEVFGGAFKPDSNLILVDVTDEGVVNIRVTGAEVKKSDIDMCITQPLKQEFSNVKEVTIVT